MVQEGNKKLGLEKVVFLVDSVDKPVVLEDLQEQVAVGVRSRGTSAHPHYYLAGPVIDEEAAKLLLNVPADLQCLNCKRVAHLLGHLHLLAAAQVEQQDVEFQVLLLKGQGLRHSQPPFEQLVAQIVGLLLGH